MIRASSSDELTFKGLISRNVKKNRKYPIIRDHRRTQTNSIASKNILPIENPNAVDAPILHFVNTDASYGAYAPISM